MKMIPMKKNNLLILLVILSLFSKIVLGVCPASSANDAFTVDDSSGNLIAAFNPTGNGNLTVKGCCVVNSSCGSGLFEVKNNGNIVSSIDSSGNLCLESGTCDGNALSCSEGIFNVKNGIEPLFSISSTGSLCLKGQLTTCQDCTTKYNLSVLKIGDAASSTINSSPTGINCGTACQSASANFNSGTNVALTGTLFSGYSITGITGCDTTSGNICYILMNSNKTVNVTLTKLNCQSPAYSGTGVVTYNGTPYQTNQPWVYDDTSVSSCSWKCNTGYIHQGTGCVLGTKVCQSFNVSCQASFANITSVVAYVLDGATKNYCTPLGWTGSNASFNCNPTLPVNQTYNLTCGINTSQSYQDGTDWSTNIYIKDCGPRCGDNISGNTAGEECDNGALNTNYCLPPNNGNCTYCDLSCKNRTNSSTGPALPYDAEVCQLFTIGCNITFAQVNSVRAFIKTPTLEKNCQSLGWQGTMERFSCDATGLTYNQVYPVTCAIIPPFFQQGINQTSNLLITQCGSYCGDSFINVSEGEQCDNGTAQNGVMCSTPLGTSCTYCNATCQENRFINGTISCGDGILNTSIGEQCDNGHNCASNYTCFNDTILTTKPFDCNSTCSCVARAPYNETAPYGFKCYNGTFIIIYRPCNSTLISLIPEPGKCLENECCYGLTANQDGVCVNSVPAGAEADNDSCLCAVSIPGKFGNICDTDGESPCWESDLGTCCGDDGTSDDWPTTYSSQTSLYKVLVTGICQSGNWTSRESHLTDYTMGIIR